MNKRKSTKAIQKNKDSLKSEKKLIRPLSIKDSHYFDIHRFILFDKISLEK